MLAEGVGGNGCMASSEWIPLSRRDVALGVGDTSWLALEARPLYNLTKDDLGEWKFIAIKERRQGMGKQVSPTRAE